MIAAQLLQLTLHIRQEDRTVLGGVYECEDCCKTDVGCIVYYYFAMET